MLALLIALLTLFGPRVWAPGAVLDQGAAPTCAVYAVEGWLTTGPSARPLEPPRALFAAAQALEGDPPDGGTTMGAVLRVLQQEGHAGPFVVTQWPLLAQLWVRFVGPITLEGRWSADMETADAAGAWHPTGAAWPRHAFFCYGITAAGDLRCQNSHGGVGRGTLSPADLASFLRRDGYVALALPASEDLMNLIMFLSWVATPAGCGAAVFALIQWLGKVAPRGLTSNQKFYGAMVLAFALPLAAYGVQIALGVQVLDPNALFEEAAVGYLVSQTIHRTNSLQSAATPILTTLESAEPLDWETVLNTAMQKALAPGVEPPAVPPAVPAPDPAPAGRPTRPAA